MSADATASQSQDQLWQDENLPVPVRLQLKSEIAAALPPGAVDEIVARVTAGVAQVLAAIGLPGQPEVRVGPGPTARPLRLAVHNRPLFSPTRMLTAVLETSR